MVDFFSLFCYNGQLLVPYQPTRASAHSPLFGAKVISMAKANEFEAALQAYGAQPCPCVVLLMTMPEDAKSPDELRILKVVGSCPNQQAAKDYCDRENAVYKPSQGGVNTYTWQVLKALT